MALLHLSGPRRLDVSDSGRNGGFREAVAEERHDASRRHAIEHLRRQRLVGIVPRVAIDIISRRANLKLAIRLPGWRRPHTP